MPPSVAFRGKADSTVGHPTHLLTLTGAEFPGAGFLFAFSQHMQTALGESATRTGLTFAPLALGVAGGSLTWQKVPARLHRPMIAAACLVAALGYGGIGFVMRSGGDGGAGLLGLQLVVGIGMGFITSPLLTVALAQVKPADAADASGVMTTGAQVAQVLGVATYGSVYLSAADGAGAARRRTPFSSPR